jgi:hypothetical protein
MELVRDILDKEILGRDDVKLGKVDGIVLELRDDEPPRVAFIELGSATFARRIGRRFERWAVMLNRRFRVRRPRYRIAFARITDYKLDVRVDLEAKHSPAFAWEHWVREHIIRRLPFVR